MLGTGADKGATSSLMLDPVTLKHTARAPRGSHHPWQTLYPGAKVPASQPHVGWAWVEDTGCPGSETPAPRPSPQPGGLGRGVQVLSQTWDPGPILWPAPHVARGPRGGPRMRPPQVVLGRLVGWGLGKPEACVPLSWFPAPGPLPRGLVQGVTTFSMAPPALVHAGCRGER